MPIIGTEDEQGLFPLPRTDLAAEFGPDPTAQWAAPPAAPEPVAWPPPKAPDLTGQFNFPGSSTLAGRVRDWMSNNGLIEGGRNQPLQDATLPAQEATRAALTSIPIAGEQMSRLASTIVGSPIWATDKLLGTNLYQPYKEATIDPWTRNIETMRGVRGEMTTPAGQAAAVAADTVAPLPYYMLGGEVAAPILKMFGLAPEITAATPMPTVLGNELSNALFKFGLPSGVNKTIEQDAAGQLPDGQLLPATARNIAGQTAQAFGPMAAEGGVAKRVATGAALGGTGSMVGAQVGNIGAPDQLKQDPFDPSSIVQGALTQGVMGGVMGRTPEGTRGIDQQFNTDAVRAIIEKVIENAQQPGPPTGSMGAQRGAVQFGGGGKPQAQMGGGEPPAAQMGGLKIERATNLPPQDAAIQERFAQQVEGNPQAAVQQYREKFGNVINTDNARELSQDYLSDRTRSAAVHEPASSVVKEVYRQMLAEPPKEGQIPEVLFSAGGTGAGKTTGLELVPEAQQAQIVYDGNMNSLASSKAKIEQALAAGKQVNIVYTFRDPVDALVNGALPRAMRQEAEFGSGRTVPIEEHAKTHVGSSEVIKQLAAEYADNPNVRFTTVNNSFGKGGARLVDLNELPQLEYNSTHAALQQALEAQRQAGAISEPVYRGFAGQGHRAGDSGQPEQASPPAGSEGQAEGQVQPVAGNKHGFEPALRVQAPPSEAPLPKKPPILAGTNNKNAPRQIAEIDSILAKHPDAAASDTHWSAMMRDALASEDVPAPPFAFIRDINGSGAADKIKSLTPGQIADADHGFQLASRFREAYTSGKMTPADTGRLFMWGFLSRGVSPYVQESLFLDAMPGAQHWISKAAAGDFTEADLPAYEKWVRSVAPAGSGQPGAGATHNLGAFGRNFLLKMSQPGPDGVSGMQHMHNLLSDPNVTGQQFRREFAKIGEGAGIDNKVLSFIALVAGHKDVMVIDRVQARQLWDDGRFADRNLYDGRVQDGKPVTGSGLADLFGGARGLLIYEAIERALGQKINDIYTAAGRPQDASIGRYHWESWVAHSGQEASHGTLGAILGDKGTTAKQGEYGGYEYGARYGKDTAEKPYFGYTGPSGSSYEFSLPAFRQFLGEVKDPKNGIVPRGFKVTESKDGPWYNRPEVNQGKLEALAAARADRVLPGGERPVQAGDAGEVAGGAGREPKPLGALLRGQRGAVGNLTPQPAQQPVAPPVARPQSSTGITPKQLEDNARAFLAQHQAALPGNHEPTHVNYDALNTSADVKGAMARMSEMFTQQIQQQRRGTVSWDQSYKEAADQYGKLLGISEKGVGSLLMRKPGTAAGTGELIARYTLAIDQMKALTEARDAVLKAGKDATPEQLANFAAQVDRSGMVFANLLGARAEAGRSLNIIRSMGRTNDRISAMNDIIAGHAGPENLQRMAAMLGSLEDPSQVAAFARNARKATTADMLLTAWKSALLTGLATHQTNVLSNLAFTMLRLPEAAVASGIGMLHGGEKVGAGEVPAMVFGMLRGAVDGARVGWNVLKTGEQMGLGKHENQGPVITGENMGLKGAAGRVADKAGAVIESPFRALGAEDAFAKMMNQRMSQYALAWRQARSEGLRPYQGSKFTDRVNELVNESERIRGEMETGNTALKATWENSTARAIAEKMIEQGDEYTFNKQLGETGKNFQRLLQTPAGKPLQIIMPFVRTPLNIFKEGNRRTPLAVLMPSFWDAVKAGGAERDQALAKVVVGSSIAGLISYLTQQGVISGGGSPDRKERVAQREAGWQPYAIHVGDKWLTYKRFEPFGQILGLAADGAEFWKYMSEEEHDKWAAMLGYSVANNLTSKTFMAGLSGIVNAIQDPQRYGENYLEQLAGSLVPGGVGQVAQAQDPVVRQVESMLDAVKARTPKTPLNPDFNSESLSPKIDTWGEQIKRPEKLWPGSPISVTQDTTDKVRSEAARLKVALDPTPKKLYDIKLTPEQVTKYGELSGKTAKQVMDSVVNSPGWDQMPDWAKKEFMTRVLEKSRGATRPLMIPDIGGTDAVVQQKLKKIGVQ